MNYTEETIKNILDELRIKEIIKGIKEEGNEHNIKPDVLND